MVHYPLIVVGKLLLRKGTLNQMHRIIPEQPIISSNIPPLNDSIVKRRAEMRANMNAFNSPIHTKPKNRYLKQKRTVRRTYKLGRSQIHPKVSVLISNRTIRNRLMTDAQELKQTPHR